MQKKENFADTTGTLAVLWIGLVVREAWSGRPIAHQASHHFGGLSPPGTWIAGTLATSLFMKKIEMQAEFRHKVSVSGALIYAPTEGPRIGQGDRGETQLHITAT